MSKADIERFIADLKADPDLLGEIKKSVGGLDSLVALAKTKGYDLDLDEAKAYIKEQAGKELSDEQLDAIAGGKGNTTADRAINKEGSGDVPPTMTVIDSPIVASAVTSSSSASVVVGG